MGIFTLRRKRKNNNIWFNIFCEDSVFIKINIDKTNFFLIHNIGEYLYFYLLKRIFFSCVHMLPKTRKKFNLLYCCVTHTNNAKFFFNVSLLIAVYNNNMSNTHIVYRNVIISWYKSLLYALNVYKPYIQHLNDIMKLNSSKPIFQTICRVYLYVRQRYPCLDIGTINDYSLFNQNRKLLKVNGLK